MIAADVGSFNTVALLLDFAFGLCRTGRGVILSVEKDGTESVPLGPTDVWLGPDIRAFDDGRPWILTPLWSVVEVDQR